MEKEECIMALPKFNEIPVYDIVIPSTQKKVKFRPFLVKEQKVLLIALESQDESQVLGSIIRTVESCAQEKINVNELTTFDVEYIFIQIRTKSAGETSDIGLACDKCEHVNEVKVKLDDIVIDKPVKPPVIKLNEKYSLQLKYPSYKFLLEENIRKKSSGTEQLYDLVAASLDSLLTEDEKILFKDEGPEETEEFLNNLTSSQFDEIMKFIQDLPKLNHTVEYTCSSCQKENKRVLQGISDFFQ